MRARYETTGTLSSPTGMQTDTTLEHSVAVFEKTKHILFVQPSNFVPPGIYPNKLKTYVPRKICTQMFTAVVFGIAKTWKQSHCVTTGEWIKKCNTCRHQKEVSIYLKLL